MAKSSKSVTEIIENIGSPHITITEDKLRNILFLHVARIRKSKEWLGAGVAVISLVATIYACTFSKKLGIEASTWEAIFIIAAVLGVAYFLKSLCNTLIYNSNEEEIINDIKTIDNSPKSVVIKAWGLRIEKRRIHFFKERNTSIVNSSTQSKPSSSSRTTSSEEATCEEAKETE